MKQKVTVSKHFSNMSKLIRICAVYQKENTLIAVCNTLPSGHAGEAICERKDSVTVETNSDEALPVKSIFLGKGQSLENVNDIKGLQALPMVASGLSSNKGVFSNTANNSDDSEEDASQELIM